MHIFGMFLSHDSLSSAHNLQTVIICAAFTVCVWSVFQGGPGIRGARGERGQPGVMVCKMRFISETI